MPAPKKIDTSADPVCGQKDPNLATEDTVVKDGKLANAFVYIKDGAATDGTKIGDYTWTPPATAAPVGPEWLSLSAARHGRDDQSEAKHHQQRSDATQRSPDAEEQSGMEPDAA